MVLQLDRREMLCAMGVGATALGLDTQRACAAPSAPPVRAITQGPKFHWFGYYDKLQFDPTDRYVLGMQIDFEDRDPKPNDEIRIGMVDLEDNDRWIELASTRAWCWQQGCMLQWRPGSNSEILFNDREEDQYVCRILDVNTGDIRTVPHSIYSVSPDGRSAVTVDYARLWRMAPGYGYNGVEEANPENKLPDDNGIWYVDLETEQAELILSIDQVAHFGEPFENMRSSPTYLKHLLFSPDGSRFIFLQRWWYAYPNKWRQTRMLTARPDGSDLRVVDGSGNTSHFIWRDPQHILAWTHLNGKSGFYLFHEPTGKAEIVGEGVMTRNGHCSYLPDTDWILNDTYPQGEERLQRNYLFHLPSATRLPLGDFYLPKQYQGTLRCDTHPRCSRDGRKIVIDSAHTGEGRQMYLIDASEYLDALGYSP